MGRKMLAVVALGLSLAMVGGCQEAKQKSQSALSFVKGNEDAVLERTPAQVMAAAKGVATDMGLIVISTSKETVEGKNVQTLVTRTSQDKKVTVTVTQEGTNNSRLDVSTGTFGDSALRHDVVTKIETRLGIKPTTQPAA